jgi:ribosomal protein S18 acetylase RimI-like enzyme
MPATLRAIRPDDLHFLLEVYASTRFEELAPLGWDEAQTRAFLEMQFTAQHEDYQRRFSQADFQLVLYDGRPVGRLYVSRTADEIRIIDIALLPDWRGRGIGGALLGPILEESDRTGRPVRLHVEKNNPALRLYARLGFERAADAGVNWLMERGVR